ncbi:hypothetical protein [Sphingomonas daechungensis]|uniref:hypothetical protein n=1 Tax=Sphingomonas daechungensis TaxID=1176646 RepID=UPI001CB99FD7|nr:hypothetical protein [Sphingomonas daechungensis]
MRRVRRSSPGITAQMGFNPLSHFARRLRRLEKLHNARIWNFRLHYLVKYEFFTGRFFLGGTEPLDDANHVGLFQQFGNGRLFILRRSLLELADRKAPSLSPNFLRKSQVAPNAPAPAATGVTATID